LKVSKNEIEKIFPINRRASIPKLISQALHNFFSFTMELVFLLHQNVILAAAGLEDVESNAQGRNRPIVMGQVGIRCRHCTMLPPRHRARGAIYYPAKLHGIYQAAQNMATAHISDHCQHVPDDIKTDLLKLRERKSSAGGGKKYWGDAVRVLGVLEDEDGLRFERG
jgi:hypothetical protein